MESFMKLAKSNTKKNLETCGVLAGLLVSAAQFFRLSSLDRATCKGRFERVSESQNWIMD